MGALAVGSLAVTVGTGPVGANGHQATSRGGYSKAGPAVALPHLADLNSFSNLTSTENAKMAVTTTNTTNAPTTTPPATIAADCSADVGQALGDWLSSLPASSTVTLPSGACYSIDSSLIIHNTSGLTINGNGSLLSQTVPGGQSMPVQGILYLRQNVNLTLNGMNVAGAFNGTNGGVSYEGNYGLFMEANHTVTVTGMNMSNIQGDFIILDPPQNNDTPGDYSLNTAVNIQSSTFTYAGYHGLTVESVNGLTVNNSTFTNMGVDAMDFEYDVYSTAFDASGQPTQAAEDNVTISNTTWANFSYDWFASIQGQSPGVQEDNIVLYHNTIDAHSPLVEVVGTNPATTPTEYQNSGLTIVGNKGLQTALPTLGGSIADPPGNVAAMTIQGVVNVNISNNSLPLYDGEPGYFENTPYISVLQTFENPNLIIGSNSFAGAYNLLQLGSGANTVAECGNIYGVNGLQGDGACPTTTPPATTPPATTPPATTPPATAVLVPSNGATQSGSQYLDASASANVSKVSFEITGGTLNDQVISGSTPTIYGWLGSWNTTTVPNGTYTLQSVASYPNGVSTTSAPITLTVNNAPPATTPPATTPPATTTTSPANPPGQPFVGLNAYELATDYGVNNGCGTDIHTSTDAFFASLPTGTVVRFWAMQPFGTASANTPNPNSLTWGPLDNVFATAAKYGDKLIPVLGNQWGDCDGVNESPGVQLGDAFYSGGYTSNTSEGPLPYIQWVKDIVARYASSPAVYAWEPINEPQACDVSEAQATTDLTSFFTAVGGEIHAVAPGSKVESGFLGTGTCGLENGDYQTVGASPGIDVLTYHDYYAATTPVGGDQYNGIAVRVAQAKALGKPIIAGEMGIEAGTSCSVTLTQRAADFSAKISAQSALGVAGFMFWDWYPGSTSSCVYENIGPGDPALALLAGDGVLHTASSNLNSNGGTAGSASSDSAGGDSWTPCSGSKCSIGTSLSAVP
jgi:mannan endo-1,4-beta-mannosidase